jgi:proteasome lid subunit RPN8/RPN11
MVLRQDLLAPAPAEGCALLLGQRHAASKFDSEAWRVALIWPCRNMVGQQADDRFELDPREQIAAQRWARSRSLQVLGSAHSHPTVSVVPSRRDRLWAVNSGLMLIMGNNLALAAWWLEVEVPRCALANVHPLSIQVMGETPLQSFPGDLGIRHDGSGGYSSAQWRGEDQICPPHHAPRGGR